ncbi:aminotransferase class V-fold PLP-dependent enzyme [Nitrosomonas sp. PY1]|uniref:aminotransferase class V-fold PLP-dependent enzyme n=1 Tax=Nitrosomonas sp. PY1 TaxID=1803906 RepID=UPI001FC7E4C9|nr:cysteine desulfurase [Nitrosomonas sp. PY1]
MRSPIATLRSQISSALNVDKIRADFPILNTKVGDKPLIYLDNAASSQMPQTVINCLVKYQTEQHANIHRAVHYLSEVATREYQRARGVLQQFIHAREDREVIFTSGTTDAINLVMHGYGRKFLQAGDEIILTTLEHHSNIVPWQMLAEEKGIKIRVVPINDRGELKFDVYKELFNSRTKFVGLIHVSNALGTINPIKEMIDFAHQYNNVPVLIDGAQAAPHMVIDVQELDCDFYTFSGHKMCAPTGIGILYGKASLLESMQPFKGGGDMITSVTFEETIYNEIPHKFEAGTPPIAAAIGFGAAIDYLTSIGIDYIGHYESELLHYATELISAIPGVKIIGTAKHKTAVLSFTVEGIHPHDIGTILNQEGIAVRTGHHCAQPVMQHFSVPATSRASFAFYNKKTEIDALVDGIRTVQKVFQ